MREPAKHLTLFRYSYSYLFLFVLFPFPLPAACERSVVGGLIEPSFGGGKGGGVLSATIAYLTYVCID